MIEELEYIISTREDIANLTRCEQKRFEIQKSPKIRPLVRSPEPERFTIPVEQPDKYFSDNYAATSSKNHELSSKKRHQPSN